MVQLGKTYGNLMVDVRATNDKLRDRAVRIVQAVTGVAPEPALEALVAAGWDVKVACLVVSSGKDVRDVTVVLEAARGRLRQALAMLSEPDVGLSGPDVGLSGPDVGLSGPDAGGS